MGSGVYILYAYNAKKNGKKERNLIKSIITTINIHFILLEGPTFTNVRLVGSAQNHK